MTNAELSEKGMKWVADDELLIDFFSTDKTNLWDVIKTIIENLGRGEIFHETTIDSNNNIVCNIAIVERIGTDNGVRLRLEKNMRSISIERNVSDMITRLWAFGSDDLTVSSVNGGKAYIDSPNIEKYGVQEGYKDYSDYTSAEKLLRNAKWEFDDKNEDRIDAPQLTISGKLIDLSKLVEYGAAEKLEIGDTVHVFDIDGTEYVQRVTEYQAYPLEPKESNISIGHIRRDFFIELWQTSEKTKKHAKWQTANNSVNIRKVQGTVNTNRNEVQSDNELLKIVGDLLTIKDTNNRVRVRLGNYNGEFVFIIYDKNKKQAIYLNEDGEGVFAGSIQTMKDCLIQGMLRVGMAGNNTKGIEFYGDSYQPDKDGNYSTPYARLVPYVANNEDYKGINVEGGKLCVNEKPVATEKDIDELRNQINVLTKRLDAMS